MIIQDDVSANPIALSGSIPIELKIARLADPDVSLDLENVDFFYSDDFADESQAEAILGPMPEPHGRQRDVKRPNGLPAYFAHLYTVPLLTKRQEQHCFRKLNYLKYLEACCIANQGPSPCPDCREELQAVRDGIERTRNQIIESNLRLVVSLAKRYADSAPNDLDDLIGTGNASLLRSVDLFDFRRGLRFSTYAFQAISRSILTQLSKAQRRRKTFVSCGDDYAETLEHDAASSDLYELHAAEARESAMKLVDALEERDREIVMSRFGINRDRNGVSFSTIAKEIGLSTTRTVQLFNRSMERMRVEAAKAG